MLQYEGADTEINGLNLCNRLSKHDRVLSYVTNESYGEVVEKNPAIVCLVVNKNDLKVYQSLCIERKLSFIISGNPERTFYDIHDYLYYHTDFYDKYEFAPVIGEKCEIHPSAIIEKGVRIGSFVTIDANTVIRKGTVIEDYCMIGCNTVIGSEGFQIIKQDGKNRKIIHSGGTLLREHVCVGDNVTIGNSLFEDTTYIGKNVTIDNFSYIAHNVQIGDNAVITAGTELCGSATVESGAWLGVNSSVLNKVIVGKDSRIGAGSVVTRNIPDNSLAYGVPARLKMVLEKEDI